MIRAEQLCTRKYSTHLSALPGQLDGITETLHGTLIDAAEPKRAQAVHENKEQIGRLVSAQPLLSAEYRADNSS